MSNDKQNDKGEIQNPDFKKEYNDLRKEAVKKLGEKYVEWYYTNLANFKKFWLKEFVYPIVFPFLSISLLRYVFHFNFNRVEGILMFSMLYLLTITGRILSKYNKLVEVLDPLIDEVKELKTNAEKKKISRQRKKVKER